MVIYIISYDKDLTSKMFICFGPDFESPHNAWNKNEISDPFVKKPTLATQHALNDHASVLYTLT